MRLLTILLALVLVSAGASPADELAEKIMKANGAGNWPKVSQVRFKFVVDTPGGKKMVRQHEWDLRKNTDTVTFNGKTLTANLNPRDPRTEPGFAAWTNDVYWMMAPLKIMDPGVIRSVKPDEDINGKKYRVLHLAFEKVGMTPSDQYNLYVDPASSMVAYWDYIPAKGQPQRFSWEDYKDVNGIKIATMHKIDGKPVVRIEDLAITME